MGFNRETFLSLFETEEDWKGFFQMVFDDEMERLLAHEDFLEGEKRGLKLIFRRISDHRYEAMGEAYKAWLMSADFEKESRDLVERAFKEVSVYDSWLNRKYDDRKLIHTNYNPYGEFQKPETTAGGNVKFVNDDIDAIAYIA